MYKLSESVYSSLFWLISGLLVWLVILPVALIGLPLIILGKVAGQILFEMPRSNLVEVERRSRTNPESQPANAVGPLLTTLLLKTLIEVPAILAAVISLQPKRLIQGEQVHAQRLQTQPAKTQGESSQEAMEVPAEEKTSGT